MAATGGRVLNSRFALSSDPLEGGSATVYKASDLQAGLRYVAIKLFGENRPQTKFLAEFFNRDIRALQELRHPAIIELIDWGTDSETGNRFLVLEWMDGGSLGDRRVDHFEGWDSFYEEAGKPILEALAFAHGRGIVHRDLKPDNVLLNADGRTKLADFGIAKIDQRYDPTRTVASFGSHPFTPPEHDDGSASAGRDCWSYAALALYCLTDVPFKDFDDVDRALGEADLPEEVANLFARCLVNKPSARPPHAGVLLTELERIRLSRESASIRRKRLYLKVARECCEKVMAASNLPTRREVERVLAADLRQGAAFQPYLHKSTNEPIRGQFRLYGTEYSYHVKIDSKSSDHLVILGASQSSVVSLEQRRDRSYQPHVEFFFAAPQKPDEARMQLAALAEEVDDWVAHQAIERAAREAQEIFRSWRGVLQLKSDLQRTLSAPARYRAFETNGDRVTFHLTSDPEGIEVGELRVISQGAGPSVRGEVEEVVGRRVTLFLTFGDTDMLPRQGEIRRDTFAAQTAIDRQKNAVDAVQYGRSVRGDLGGLLVDPEKARRPDPPASVDFVHSKLDDAKRAAVAKALGAKDFLTVEGPPGTGKTTFIAEVVLQTLRQDPDARILIASQTHVALDNALERIGENAPQLSMVRIGRAESGKVGAAATKWLVENQLLEWRQRVVERSRTFIDKWAEARGLSPVTVQVASLYEEAASIQAQVRRVEATIAELQQQETDAAQEEAETTSGDLTKDVVSEQAEEKRLTIVDELDAARSELSALHRERKPLLERLVARKAAKNESELRRLEPAEFRERSRALLANAGTEVGQLRKLLEIHGEWVQRFGRSNEFRAALMARASVVGTTCIGFAGAAGTAESSFDLCILDEASRATPTEALVPMARSRRWILVGDPMQLPPFVDDAIRRDLPLPDYGLTREQLEGTLLDRLMTLLPEECQTSLTIQHRMAPAIGNLVSDCFYNGTLKNGRDDDQNPYELVLPHRVTWITTSGLTDARETAGAGKSFSNLAEARVIRDLVKRLDFVAGAKRLRHTVVLLAAYADQCETLERTAAALVAECRHLSIEVHTVDSFQGREADVAIYSVTRSNAEGRLGFLGDERRLNVALSRGKEILVLVGDHDFCRTARGENPLKPVLEHVERNRQACDVMDARSL